MDLITFLRDHLPQSVWSLVVVVTAVVAVGLWRILRYFYEERIHKLSSLLDLERNFSGRFKDQLEELSEHADAELRDAWDRIEELERQVAIAAGEPVPENHALDVFSRAAKGCANFGGDEAHERLVSIWGEAGLAIGRAIRWKLWYRPSRVPKVFEMVLDDAPPPRGRTDSIVFHTIRCAWSATIQSMVLMFASRMPQVALDYLKDPGAKSREFSDYLDNAAQLRMNEITALLDDSAWDAFLLGTSLGMSGREPEPGKEYVLEGKAHPDPASS